MISRLMVVSCKAKKVQTKARKKKHATITVSIMHGRMIAWSYDQITSLMQDNKLYQPSHHNFQL